MRRLAVLLLLMSSAAVAQPQPDKVWTAAPVSPLSGSGGTVAPADRAGSGSTRTSDAGPDATAPFSGQPSGLANSQSSPASGDTSPGRDAPTPNLGR